MYAALLAFFEKSKYLSITRNIISGQIVQSLQKAHYQHRVDLWLQDNLEVTCHKSSQEGGINVKLKSSGKTD